MIWLLCSVAFASGGDTGLPEAEPLQADPGDQPEYNRLTQELELMAMKNAWAGAERAFVALLQTNVPPTFEDWLRGAHAARALGDMSAVRVRLLRAQGLKEDREILDWLFQLDQSYGTVVLTCDAGLPLPLEAVQVPFDPDQQRAIELAQAHITESCAFEGLLPAGQYRFYDQELQVVPQEPTVRLDLRGIDIDRKTRKRLLKAAKKPG